MAMNGSELQHLVAELSALTGESPEQALVNAVRMRLAVEQRREELVAALDALHDATEADSVSA